MSTEIIDAGRHDRIHIYIPTALARRLDAFARPTGMTGGELDELVDGLLDDVDGLQRAVVKIRSARPVANPIVYRGNTAPVAGARITCACCPHPLLKNRIPGPCRCQFTWRGSARCGCSPERIATLRDETAVE